MCLLWLSDFNKTWTVSTAFRKILKYQISWNPFCGSRVFSTRTDGQTDGQTRRSPTAAFRNFANAPRKFLIKSMKTAPFCCTLSTDTKEWKRKTKFFLNHILFEFSHPKRTQIAIILEESIKENSLNLEDWECHYEEKQHIADRRTGGNDVSTHRALPAAILHSRDPRNSQ